MLYTVSNFTIRQAGHKKLRVQYGPFQGLLEMVKKMTHKILPTQGSCNLHQGHLDLKTAAFPCSVSDCLYYRRISSHAYNALRFSTSSTRLMKMLDASRGTTISFLLAARLLIHILFIILCHRGIAISLISAAAQCIRVVGHMCTLCCPSWHGYLDDFCSTFVYVHVYVCVSVLFGVTHQHHAPAFLLILATRLCVCVHMNASVIVHECEIVCLPVRLSSHSFDPSSLPLCLLIF